jgi:hypothetical protein
MTHKKLREMFKLPDDADIEVKVFVDADCVYPKCTKLVVCLDTFRCWEHCSPQRQAEIRAQAGLPSEDR